LHQNSIYGYRLPTHSITHYYRTESWRVTPLLSTDGRRRKRWAGQDASEQLLSPSMKSRWDIFFIFTFKIYVNYSRYGTHFHIFTLDF